MILAFTLAMPNRASWNGGWSGENRFFAIVKNFGRGKRNDERARKILAQGSYYYRWSDGWGASVSVKEVDTGTARKIRSKSQGFGGYDWMVESILLRGKILADHEVASEKLVKP